MRNSSWAVLLLAASVALAPSVSRAAIHLTDNLDLTTDPNPGGGNSDGTGVWFNPLNGYAESRGFLFPGTLFEDGKYFLVMDTRFLQTEAQVFVQGFFSRGNGVIYESTSNLNPKRFGDGEVIGPASGYQSPGAGFSDLGPTFGNWAAGGHGYLGLTIRNPAGASASDIFYGYAEINVNPDFSTTLLSFAYNDVQGQPITTVSTVPEPTAMALMPIALAAMAIFRRRKA
ncbi:MAG: PEP-CTERM sorting domain-containing protein [Verrucomicrobiota bacterium]